MFTLYFVGTFVLMQYGSFVGPKTVQVDGVDYTADHILVAVGGKPTVPQMEGAEHCINSNGFFQLEVSCRNSCIGSINCRPSL